MMKTKKFAGICGLTFVVLSMVVAVIAPPFPTLDVSINDTFAYYKVNEQAFLLGNFLACLSILPSLFFAMYFLNAIENTGDKYFRNFFFFTAAFTHSFAFVSLVAFQATGLSVRLGVANLTKLMADFSNVTLCFYFLLQGFYLAVFAAASLSKKVLPRALGYAAAALGAVSMITSVGALCPKGILLPGGDLTMASYIGFGLWIIATSISLLVSKSR